MNPDTTSRALLQALLHLDQHGDDAFLPQESPMQIAICQALPLLRGGGVTLTPSGRQVHGHTPLAWISIGS